MCAVQSSAEVTAYRCAAVGASELALCKQVARARSVEKECGDTDTDLIKRAGCVPCISKNSKSSLQLLQRKRVKGLHFVYFRGAILASPLK